MEKIKMIVELCNNNEGFVSAILSVITIFISIYVLYKSNKNSNEIAKKQQEQDKIIELRQEDMQRRQIKVDTYPYRLECWKTLQILKDVIETLKVSIDHGSLKNRSHTELYTIYKKIFVANNCTAKEICLSLKQAESVFPLKSWNDIKLISKSYLKIDTLFKTFDLYDDILLDEEKEYHKHNALHEIEDSVRTILSKINYTISLVDIDLCIADLHEVRGIYNDGLNNNDDF